MYQMNVKLCTCEPFSYISTYKGSHFPICTHIQIHTRTHLLPDTRLPGLLQLVFLERGQSWADTGEKVPACCCYHHPFWPEMLQGKPTPALTPHLLGWACRSLSQGSVTGTPLTLPVASPQSSLGRGRMRPLFFTWTAEKEGALR
jgi:hypothetical protein